MSVEVCECSNNPGDNWFYVTIARVGGDASVGVSPVGVGNVLWVWVWVRGDRALGD